MLAFYVKIMITEELLCDVFVDTSRAINVVFYDFYAGALAPVTSKFMAKFVGRKGQNKISDMCTLGQTTLHSKAIIF